MSLASLMQKEEKLAIGLMSGTSADGVDAALVHIKGHGLNTKLTPLAFVNQPFAPPVRQRILQLAAGSQGGSREFCLMNALLGQLYLQASLAVCEKAGIAPAQVDLAGCHGQTVYHQPVAAEYLGHSLRSTLQIGDFSLLCEELGAVTVSDFRVRDMAAGGQGAPLVPYTEYLLYRSNTEDIALQNIGGIGNISFLPAGGSLANTIAFDTGPGNVLMDAMMARMTQNKSGYDEGGKTAAAFAVSEELLAWLMQDEYLRQKPPKTTGREYYNQAFLERCLADAQALLLSEGSVLRTLTCYTASTIAQAVQTLLPKNPKKLIVGGGGSRNATLMAHLRSALPGVQVLTNEDIGLDSDAKEAVAFALLANEAIHGVCSNAPSATGAAHPVVLGKISQ